MSLKIWQRKFATLLAVATMGEATEIEMILYLCQMAQGGQGK